MKALVTGATGFIGKRLAARLVRPVVLSRNPDRARAALGDVAPFAWSAEAMPPPPEALAGVEAVFHLAGEPVAQGRWNAEKKQRILNSRKLGTRHLVDALEIAAQRPRVLVCASAIGFYGSRGEETLDESSRAGDDFLATVCREWEDAAERATALGVRVVKVRIGIVLGEAGGALSKMLPLFKLGLGGRLASGRQWMPWVHVDDVVGILLHAAAHEEIRGVLNAVAPHPVTNREFTQVLASVLHRPALFPVPAFGLRLGVGEFAEILLASQRVVPKRTIETGYQFQYPHLAGALAAVVHGEPTPRVPAATKREVHP